MSYTNMGGINGHCCALCNLEFEELYCWRRQIRFAPEFIARHIVPNSTRIAGADNYWLPACEGQNGQRHFAGGNAELACFTQVERFTLDVYRLEQRTKQTALLPFACLQ